MSPRSKPVRFDRVPGVDCSAPGAYRVEAFTPGHASLDVVIYACRDHADQARREWTGKLWAYVQDDVMPGKVCGDRTDFREPEPQDVEPGPQDVGELGLLEPMPYRLQVDGRVHARGTLQEVQAAVAELVTLKLAINPVSFAADAQAVNAAFNGGTVEQEVSAHGEWFTILAVDSDHPVRLKVTREA